MRNLISAALIASAMALTMTGCHKQDENSIKFMYWGDLKEIAIVDDLIQKFTTENPGIKVENERVAAGGPPYDEKLTTLFAGKEEPDVFLLSSYYSAKYAQLHTLADLTDLAKKSPVLDIKDFYPEIIKEFSEDGHLYVIPRDVAPVACIYYNKNAFKEAGLKFPDGSWTWPQDFAKISQKLVKMSSDGKEVDRWGYMDDWNLSDMFIYSAGGSYFDDPFHPTKVTLDSPAAMEGIQFRADLMNVFKSMPDSASMSSAGAAIGSADLFKRGKVAMFYSGSWQIPNFRDIKDFEWDIALPPMNSHTHKRAYSGGGSGYAIAAHAQGQKLTNSWKLVEFLTKPESLSALASAGLIQPANLKVAEGPGFIDGKVPAHKKILLTALHDCYEQPSDQTFFREVMASGLDQTMEEVTRGEQKAVDVMPAAVKAANDKFFSGKANN